MDIPQSTTEYSRVDEAKPKSWRKRSILILSAIAVTVGVVAFVSVGSGNAGSDDSSSRYRLHSRASEYYPTSYKLFRTFVTITGWEDIQKVYFCPFSSHGNLPWPISSVMENIFESNGQKFWGVHDTEGTAERLSSLSDAINRLGFTLDELKEIGTSAAAALRSDDSNRELSRIILNAIIPRFVPSFEFTDEFYDPYRSFTNDLFPSPRWVDPFRPSRMADHKVTLLEYFDGRADVFHHSMAASGLIQVLERIPHPDIETDIIDAQSNGGYNVIRLFLGEGVPVDAAPRTTTAETDFDGLVESPLSVGSVVMLQVNRPDIRIREERFLGCAAQRVLTHVAYYALQAFYPDSEFVMIRSGEPAEVLNPSSTKLFRRQGEIEGREL